jgi:hypothetical protein
MNNSHEYYRKPFDRSSHAVHDAPAREAAIQIVAKFLGLRAENNPDIHGIDVLVYSKTNRLIGVIECEIKGNWKGYSFCFPDMNFLPKKARVMCDDVPPELDCYCFMFNADLSRVCIISRGLLAKYRDNLKTVDNRFGNDETFLSIPVHELAFMTVPGKKEVA